MRPEKPELHTDKSTKWRREETATLFPSVFELRLEGLSVADEARLFLEPFKLKAIHHDAQRETSAVKNI